MHWAEGPEIIEFENKLAKYLGVEHCITMNSGTSALHAIMLSQNIKKNDEILVPSFTFISTVNSALMVDAKPKFVDIETDRPFELHARCMSSVTNNYTRLSPEITMPAWGSDHVPFLRKNIPSTLIISFVVFTRISIFY